jgi:hypothetical protein
LNRKVRTNGASSAREVERASGMQEREPPFKREWNLDREARTWASIQARMETEQGFKIAKSISMRKRRAVGKEEVP